METTVAVVGIVVIFLYMAVKIVKEYERLVVFRLGRLAGARGPGIVILIPFVDRYARVSLRVLTMDVPTQEVITRDNVTASVNAVTYYRVVNAENAIVNVEDYMKATEQLAQTTLRSVAGQAELDELLSERDKLNLQIQQILDDATNPWGVKVTAVEIKDVLIPAKLQQAISRQASAERERRAVVIQAEGEKQAAQKRADAAGILSSQRGGLFLRLLGTLPEITSQEGNIIAFPLPMELRNLAESLDVSSIAPTPTDEENDGGDGDQESAEKEED